MLCLVAGTLFFVCVSVLCIEFAAVVKEEEFPEFYGWVERMKGPDAVKVFYQPPEAHLAFSRMTTAMLTSLGKALPSMPRSEQRTCRKTETIFLYIQIFCEGRALHVLD